MRYLIMCRSLTYAQKSAALLERHGIASGISKAPAGLSGRGCAYSITVSEQNGAKAVQILRNANLLYGKVYEQSEGNTYREAEL